MTSGKGDDGTKYAWQSWPADSLEGMPPKRRRLAVWVLWWLIILSVVPEIVLDALRVPQPWRSFAYAAVVVAIFAPLIRGAVDETRTLRAEGVHVPTYTVTRKTLISFSVLTCVLWIAFVVVAFFGKSYVPLAPIACTIWLVVMVRRWRTMPQQWP
jgi:hypothetical protein